MILGEKSLNVNFPLSSKMKSSKISLKFCHILTEDTRFKKYNKK